jgi:hypothetical protein
VALAVAAAVARFVDGHLSHKLSVVTDIVGYPTFWNYDSFFNFNRYRVVVLLFPACALAIYHAAGWVFPRSSWPDSAAPDTSALERPGKLLGQAARALAVGAVFGLGVALARGGGGTFWLDVAGTASLYVALACGAAALWARARGEAFFSALARINAVAASLSVLALYAASRATHVSVESDGADHRYPWFPGWLAGVAIASTCTAICVCLRRARDAAAARRVELWAVLLIPVPVAVFLYTAALPAIIGDIDLFHWGEQLAGTWLFTQGAFPWRDIMFIHGLLQDILISTAGRGLLADTAWGANGGATLLLVPLWWVSHYLLCVYLTGRGRPLLAALIAVPLLGLYGHLHGRFAPLPLVCLAFAALLRKETWGRAALFSGSVLLANILVPELAYAAPGCGAALIASEIGSWRKGAGVWANLPRTLRAAATGALFLGIWFAFLGLHHAAGDFLYYYATFAPGHELTGAFPLPETWNTELPYFIHMILPPGLVLLTIWYVAAMVRMRRKLEDRDWVAVSLAIFSFGYYIKFLSRPDTHVYQAAAPALPLAVYALARVLTFARDWSRTRAVVPLGAGAALLYLVWLAPAGAISRLAALPSRFAAEAPGPPDLAMLGWSTLGRKELPAWQELGDFLDAWLEPDDQLFDFTDQPALYHYLLARKPATRYFHVSMALRMDTQRDLLRELQRRPPKLVVFDSKAGGLGDWDGVPRDVRHYAISDYLLEHYRPFARLHSQTFYARRDWTPVLRHNPPPGVDILEEDESLRTAQPCDWGFAQIFLDHRSLVPGTAVAVADTMANGRLTVSGWAASPGSKAPAREVVVTAGGEVLARGAPSLPRPDVVKAFSAPPPATGFGFTLSATWIRAASFTREDVRVYVISEDGAVRELGTQWHAASPPGQPLPWADAKTRTAQPEAMQGYVESVQIDGEVMTRLDFPSRAPAALAGLQLEVEGSAEETTVTFSDHPEQELDRTMISFRIPGGWSGTLPLLLDNCPQWHALHGQRLYLGHPPGTKIRKVRALELKG